VSLGARFSPCLVRIPIPLPARVAVGIKASMGSVLKEALVLPAMPLGQPLLLFVLLGPRVRPFVPLEPLLRRRTPLEPLVLAAKNRPKLRLMRKKSSRKSSGLNTEKAG
jgi:hypothetical protein